MPVNNSEIEADKLTEAEKKKLLSEHIAYINDFNRHLPDNLKIRYDQEAFERKLNDPEEVLRYRRSLAREEKLARQEQIYSQLEGKFGTPPEGRHYLNRNIFACFKTDGSDASNKYNEDLYSNYCKNPEKLLYTKIKNIVNFNPESLYNAFENKGALVDFYDQHQELCEDAFVYSSMIKDESLEWVTPQLKNAIDCMKKPIESLGEAQKAAYAAVGSSSMTMPDITTEQAMILMGSGPQYVGKDARPEIRNTIMNALAKSNDLEQPKEYYDRLREHGMALNPNFYVSHVAEERRPDGSYKEVTFDAVLMRPNDVNLNIRQRTADEMWHIKNISKEYEREYLGIWQKKFTDFGDRREFNFAQIKEANKGNVFERTFRRTSREYKEFIKSFEDFNNPESKDYLNRAKLREKADAYSARKLAQGKTLEQMDATSRGRTTLVNNVIATLDYMDMMDNTVRNQIDAKLYPEPGAQPVREQFLKESDVNDRSNEIKDVQNVLDVLGKKMDQNKDLNDDLEDDDLNI